VKSKRGKPAHPSRTIDTSKARAALQVKNAKNREKREALIAHGKKPVIPKNLMLSLPSSMIVHAYDADGSPICAQNLKHGKLRKETGYAICRNRAGERTDHEGTGRCYLHRGNVGGPVVTGRYTFKMSPRLQAIYDQLAQDPDPLNLVPELTAARALFQDWVDRFDSYSEALIAWHESFAKGNGDREHKPMKVLDIADGRNSLEIISRIVARIEHIRAENAVSKKKLVEILEAMGKVVEAHVMDAQVLGSIRRGWLNIRTS
jgi:hypothetical protein